MVESHPQQQERGYVKAPMIGGAEQDQVDGKETFHLCLVRVRAAADRNLVLLERQEHLTSSYFTRVTLRQCVTSPRTVEDVLAMVRVEPRGLAMENTILKLEKKAMLYAPQDSKEGNEIYPRC